MAKNKKYKKVVRQGNIYAEPQPAGTYVVNITQPERGGLDVEDYMVALREWEDVDYPNRSKMLDIMEEAKTDAHLSSVSQKRKAMILSSPIEFTRDGVPDEKIGEQIRSPWFQNLLSEIVDAEEWSDTLVQLRREGEWLTYDSIPRKHYDPIRQIIKRRQSDIEGTPFDEYNDLLLIGEPRSLGLLAKASLYVIYKRNAMSDFAAFIEKFGRPFIEGEYEGYDEKIRRKLMRDLFTHSGGSVLVRPAGSKITLHDIASKGATSDLHKTFITICNEEISKLYLGSTLTVEVGDKGTQALGTVHQAGQDQLGRLSKQRLLNVLNYELTDVFANLGFDTRGGTFDFAVPQNKDLSSRIQIDTMLYNMGVKFPESYFQETYGVPAPAKGDEVISKFPAKEESKTPEPEQDPEPPAEPAPPKEPEQDPEEEKDESAEEKVSKKKERSLKNFLLSLLPGYNRKDNFKAKIGRLYRPAVNSSETGVLFDQSVLKTALERIYKGEINPQTDIEENLFNEFWRIFNKAVDDAFPGIQAGDADWEFYNQIRENNAGFAAFKTHKFQNELAEAMLDEDGDLKPFRQWRKDIDSLVQNHAEHHLQTEYDTFVTRAHQAADWKQFEREKDILPRLRWEESTSVTPRESHRVFWGRVFEMDDPILDEHRPGNEWGCKCGLSSTDEPATDNGDLPTDKGGHAPGLGGNPGKTAEIISDDHPYFTDAHKGAAKAVKKHLKNLSNNE